jgi:hemolysin TlyA family protein
LNGQCESREKAKKAIAEKRVVIGETVMIKPSFEVDETVLVHILPSEHNEYVGRGGNKLEAALASFGIDVAGLCAIDIGASTGGFTDCLLKNGARKVYAIDAGHSQLHPDLKKDNRVISLEQTNAKILNSTMFGTDVIDIAVMDVSFISQTLLFDAVGTVLKSGGILVTLIKPQFEVGRANVGKNGIVKNERIRLLAVENVKKAAQEHGFQTVDVMDSPLLGGSGNKEYLAYFLLKNE